MLQTSPTDTQKHSCIHACIYTCTQYIHRYVNACSHIVHAPCPPPEVHFCIPLGPHCPFRCSATVLVKVRDTLKVRRKQPVCLTGGHPALEAMSVVSRLNHHYVCPPPRCQGGSSATWRSMPGRSCQRCVCMCVRTPYSPSVIELPFRSVLSVHCVFMRCVWLLFCSHSSVQLSF